MALDQRDPGLHRGGDVGRHEAARASADDDQVAVEAARLRPAGVDPAPPEHADEPPRQQREDAQQHEAAEERRRQHVAGRFDGGELAAGVHVDDRSGKHADLADDVEPRRPDRGEPHQQVDEPEREHRHQAQREQVERAVARDPFVHRRERLAEPRLHGVAQQVARGEEREQRAEAGGEGHDDEPDPEAEHRAGREGQHDGARNRHRRRRDVHGEEREHGRERSRLVGADQRIAAGLEVLERQQGAQPEVPVAEHDRQDDDADAHPQQPLRLRGHHAKRTGVLDVPASRSRARRAMRRGHGDGGVAATGSRCTKPGSIDCAPRPTRAVKVKFAPAGTPVTPSMRRSAPDDATRPGRNG